MTTRNEAAERLVRKWDREDAEIQELLAAERRATVERIRAAIRAKGHIGPEHGEAAMGANAVHFVVIAILDEEVAR